MPPGNCTCDQYGNFSSALSQTGNLTGLPPISTGGGGASNVTANPNGVTTGTAAAQLVFNTVNSTLWIFEGTVGQNTGWIQLI